MFDNLLDYFRTWLCIRRCVGEASSCWDRCQFFWSRGAPAK